MTTLEQLAATLVNAPSRQKELPPEEIRHQALSLPKRGFSFSTSTEKAGSFFYLRVQKSIPF